MTSEEVNRGASRACVLLSMLRRMRRREMLNEFHAVIGERNQFRMPLLAVCCRCADSHCERASLGNVVTRPDAAESMCNRGYSACVARCYMREFISGVDYL